MKIKTRRFFFALTLVVLSTTALAFSDTLMGTWGIEPSSVPDQVRLEFRFVGSDYTTDVALSTLGLSKDQLDSHGHNVHFALTREAGSFDCTGWASDGRGGGYDTFTTNPDFLVKMRTLGYDDISPKLQMTAAAVDLTTSYVDEIARAGYPHLDFDKLIAFRALGVDSAFIRSMQSLFAGATIEGGQMISLKALRVTPDYVSQMRNAGMTVDSPGDAVSLMALHVDQAYIQELATNGYTHLTSHQIIEMRALHIDGAFIAKVRARGLGHPSVEELIKLKAMNIV